MALQEGREPNIQAAAGSPSPRASGNSEILEQRRARKAAAQARLDKKNGKKASRQSQQQNPAAEVNFDVDWDNVAAPPTPKSGTPSVQTEAVASEEKWNVEFEDDDDWGAMASSSAAPSPAPVVAVETQSDDWVDWGNEASASPAGDEESSVAAPRKVFLCFVVSKRPLRRHVLVPMQVSFLLIFWCANI